MELPEQTQTSIRTNIPITAIAHKSRQDTVIGAEQRVKIVQSLQGNQPILDVFKENSTGNTQDRKETPSARKRYIDNLMSDFFRQEYFEK